MITVSKKYFKWSLVCAVIFFCSFPASAGEYTGVISSFYDKDDPFGLNLSIGYERYYEKGSIVRETTNNNNPMEIGGNYLDNTDYYGSYKFGNYKHTQNIINLQLDLGLFKDFAFRMNLPIILSDDRSLTGGSNAWRNSQGLFSQNFNSTQRSGIDQLVLGLWWGILNQDRIYEHPSITAFIEGRFGVGSPLTASCASADNDLSNCLEATNPGISHNMHQLRLGAKFSRRQGIVEPFMGIDAMVGWYKDKDLMMDSGALNDMPPVVGTFDFGVEIIPWEVPEYKRKFVITLGGGASFVSEGRTYTPLFDALGTSAYFEENADFGGGSSTEGRVQEALDSWNGMTDIQNYAQFYGRLDLTLQPAKYIKFNAGLKLGYKTDHFITKTDQCPAGKVENGVCTAHNLSHRQEIDIPGNRFRVEDTFVWSLFIDAIAQF